MAIASGVPVPDIYVLDHENGINAFAAGYETGDVQQVKPAAIQAEWETHEPPAPFTLFGLPNQETMETESAVKIPWVMGLIATRATDEEVVGLKDLMKHNEQRIYSGIEAYKYLTLLRSGDKTPQNIAAFEQYKEDLGYGLLLKKYVENPADATSEQIQMAVRDTIPNVAPLFWTFRIMVASGFWMLFLIGLEIPLVLRINRRFAPALKSNVATVFSTDYVGAFVGALVWAFERRRNPEQFGGGKRYHINSHKISR